MGVPETVSLLEQTVKLIFKYKAFPSFIPLVTSVDDKYIFDKVDEIKKKKIEQEYFGIILSEINLWSSSSPSPCSEYIHLENVSLRNV